MSSQLTMQLDKVMLKALKWSFLSMVKHSQKLNLQIQTSILIVSMLMWIILEIFNLDFVELGLQILME